jgi:hypothetical protein
MALRRHHLGNVLNPRDERSRHEADYPLVGDELDDGASTFCLSQSTHTVSYWTSLKARPAAVISALNSGGLFGRGSKNYHMSTRRDDFRDDIGTNQGVDGTHE